MTRTAVYLVMIMTAGATSAMAQGRTTAGIFGGLNIANVHTEVEGDTSRDDPRNGLFGGLTVMFRVQQAFSVEADALFVQNGTEAEEDGLEIKYHTSYLSIPIMARYDRPLGNGNVRFHALAGPAFGLRLSESFTVNGEDVSEITNFEDDVFKGFDTAIVFGGGIDVSRLRVDLRFSLGLTNVLTDEFTDVFIGPGTDVSGKNRSVMLGVGYSF